MKIILISSLCSDIGSCIISPLLKKEGHEIKLLFVPDLLENYLRPLSNKSTKRINEFINGVDIIGINSFSENYHNTAVLVDDIKKKIKAPVVWGGIHATVRPQDCIKHADIVCVGEGEEAILELVKKLETKENFGNIKNLLFRSNEADIDKVELHAPIDLNALLPLDYDLDSQYILENNKIRNVEESDFEKGLFFSFSSRGCPFRCSYCSNALMRSMYRGEKFCRQRSVENTIKELKEIKRRFASCKEIWFNEADFLSGKSQKELGDFANRYKTEIDLPFSIWSHPAAINEENVRTLKQAGCKKVSLGTINASDRIQRQIYKRNFAANNYQTRAEILKKYEIEVEYDVILCNPYEDDSDLVRTIELLMQLPKPFEILLFNLAYFPGTELYELALKDGIISKDSRPESYRKTAYKVWRFQGDSVYLNIVLSLMKGTTKRIGFLGCDCYGILPECVLRLLIKKPVIKFFNHLPLRRLIYDVIANFIKAGHIFAKKIFYLTKQLSLFSQKII